MAQSIAGMLTSVPAWSNSLTTFAATTWIIGLFTTLQARGAWTGSFGESVQSQIVATEGALSGLAIVVRWTINYNPTGDEYTLGIAQALWSDYYVASDLDQERVGLGNASLGESIIQDPQVVLESSQASQAWAGLEGSAEDIATFLANQETLLQEMRDAAQEQAAAEQKQADDQVLRGKYSILGPLSIPIADASPGPGESLDEQIADRLAALAALDPSEPYDFNPPSFYSPAGAIVPAVMGAGAIEGLKTVTGVAIAAAAAGAVASRVASETLPTIAGGVGGLQTATAEGLQEVADKLPDPAAFLAALERMADAQERIADATEAIETLLTGGEETPVLADHIQALAVNLENLAGSRSEIDLSFQGVKATARIGTVEVEE